MINWDRIEGVGAEGGMESKLEGQKIRKGVREKDISFQVYMNEQVPGYSQWE